MPFTLTIAIVPRFNAMATLALIDPFRAANYLAGDTLYRWRLVTTGTGPVQASNGLRLDAETMGTSAADHTPDLGVVSSSWTPEAHYGDRALFAAMRTWVRNRSALCGLDTGGFLLARAGLLAGRRATVHYEHMDAFAELHRDIHVSEDLYVIDGDRMTCAGGAASADLALHLVRTHHGDALANAAAHYIFHDRLRGPGERQSPSQTEPVGVSAPSHLRRAISLMERHLEEPLAIPDLAADVGLSQRQLERLFRTYTQASAVRYYRDIRLDRARGLITQTELPVLEVALACGFGSPEHFSRAYRSRFGLSPRDDRIQGRVPFEFRAWPMHHRANKGSQ